MPLWGKNDNSANAPMQVVHNQTSTPQDDMANTNIGLFANSNATFGVFGVDSNEMRVARVSGESKPAHSGWVLRKEGTGGRAGRITYEVLVAGGDIVDDYENVAFPNVGIAILRQPESVAGPAGPATLSVHAEAVPTGTLVYHWQVDGGPGVQQFSNVANSGLYASATGNTTAVLTISNTATLSGNTFRVQIDLADANTRFSTNATITVV